MHMPTRQRKLILVLLFVPFLVIYTGLVLVIADHIPSNWLIQLVFYVVAGTLWAFPLKPILKWVNGVYDTSSDQGENPS